MSKQWKPGDVAMVTAEGVEKIAFRDCDDGWTSVNGWQADQLVTSARPLLVIDPEDEAQVRAAHRQFHQTWAGAETFSYSDVQAALRALANPVVKPEEPTGLGAVVEDASKLWVKADNENFQWFCVETTDWRRWVDFPDTVTVLHEGYKP